MHFSLFIKSSTFYFTECLHPLWSLCTIGNVHSQTLYKKAKLPDTTLYKVEIMIDLFIETDRTLNDWVRIVVYHKRFKGRCAKIQHKHKISW